MTIDGKEVLVIKYGNVVWSVACGFKYDWEICKNRLQELNKIEQIMSRNQRN